MKLATWLQLVLKLRMHEGIIRIMTGYNNKVSCRRLFKRLPILPFPSQYILSLMLFVAKNKQLFVLNSDTHSESTRQLDNLHHPITNLTVYQQGVHYMGVKVFNNLPPHIKDASNKVRKFEKCLKRFLHIHSFYSLEEYFQHKSWEPELSR